MKEPCKKARTLKLVLHVTQKKRLPLTSSKELRAFLPPRRDPGGNTCTGPTPASAVRPSTASCLRPATRAARAPRSPPPVSPPRGRPVNGVTAFPLPSPRTRQAQLLPAGWRILLRRNNQHNAKSFYIVLAKPLFC